MSFFNKLEDAGCISSSGQAARKAAQCVRRKRARARGCVCVCVSHFVSKSFSTRRGWQQERESATNEDTLDFLVILGLIIPAYLP